MYTRTFLIAVFTLLFFLPPFTPATSGQDADPAVLIQQINQLIREKKMEDALRLAETLASRYPGYRSQFVLGLVLFNAERFMESCTVLREAAGSGALDPNSTAKACQMLGIMDLSFGKTAEAEQWFSRALQVPGLEPGLRPELEQQLQQASSRKEKEQMVPRESELLVLYHPPLKNIGTQVIELERQLSAWIREFSAEFPVPVQPKITFYFYPDEAYFRRLNPGDRRGWFDLKRQIIHAWPNDQLRHELFHLLIYRINGRNYPSYLISEGFAEYLVRRQSPGRLWPPAALLGSGNRIPPLARLDQGRYFENNSAALDLAASFTAFLMESFGREQYLAFWKSARGLDQDAPQFFRQDAARLLEEWREKLRTVRVTEELRWQPFIRHVLEPGLFQEGIQLLSRPLVPSSAFQRLLLSICHAGEGHIQEARELLGRDTVSEFESLMAEGDWKFRRRLLLAQLDDAAGFRDRAVQTYRGLVSDDAASAEIKDQAALFIRTPCRALDFKKPAAAGLVRADHLTRYLLTTNITAGDLLQNVLTVLSKDQLGLLFKKLELPVRARLNLLESLSPSSRLSANPREIDAAWDALAPSLNDWQPVTGFLRAHLQDLDPESIVEQMRQAGISVSDIWRGLEAGFVLR